MLSRIRTRHIRRQLYEIFYDVDSRAFMRANDVFTVAATVSILAFLLGTTPSFSSYRNVWLVLEWCTLLVFVFEYVGRIIAHGRHAYGYVFSTYGAVDLLAIAPSLLGLGNFTFLKTMRIMRMLRTLRFLHVRHILDIPQRFHSDLEDHHHRFPYHIGSYFTALVLMLVVTGVFAYQVGGTSVLGDYVPQTLQYFSNFMLGVVVYTPTSMLQDIALVSLRFTVLLLVGLCLSLVATWIRRPHRPLYQRRPKPRW